MPTKSKPITPPVVDLEAQLSAAQSQLRQAQESQKQAAIEAAQAIESAKSNLLDLQAQLEQARVEQAAQEAADREAARLNALDENTRQILEQSIRFNACIFEALKCLQEIRKLSPQSNTTVSIQRLQSLPALAYTPDGSRVEALELQQVLLSAHQRSQALARFPHVIGQIPDGAENLFLR